MKEFIRILKENILFINEKMIEIKSRVDKL